MALYLVWLLAAPPSLALLYLALEIACGLRAVKLDPAQSADSAIAVVVPAHNEAALIAGTVEALKRRIAKGTRILVIADNCTDETGALALEAGAEVLERFDAARRGKGYALARAQEHLALDPPAVVLVLDADCRISRGTAGVLAACSLALDAPVQAVNLLRTPAEASPLVRLSNFAFLVKNLVRARGLYRLGGGIPLFGTGMAFPWRLFSRLDLATAESVEDLRLAVDLAQQSVRVHLCERVEVSSDAAQMRDSLDQRGRWEHGFLRIAAHYGLSLLAGGLMRGARHQVALGAHLLVPPLALLILSAVMMLGVVSGLGVWIGDGLPAALLAVSLVTALLTIGMAWYAEGRQILTLATLARAPLYILWKIPLYVRLMTARHGEWNRTRRLNEDP
jgi:cellulose synthase/poly-beta-1,6-N-acetylglucosamine synthase-like glycosyltransferase